MFLKVTKNQLLIIKIVIKVLIPGRFIYLYSLFDFIRMTSGGTVRKLREGVSGWKSRSPVTSDAGLCGAAGKAKVCIVCQGLHSVRAIMEQISNRAI